MARPIRIEFSGALYHVTSRGDRREAIYEDDADREQFLSVLADVVRRFNWVCHGWCLMSNHYHLLVETPDANLSKGMRQLNGVFTQCSNRRHGRVGHVFQGRFKAILVDGDDYLLELARYVVLNPVRAGMVVDPGDWRWSSYQAMIGEVNSPDWLATNGLLAMFDTKRDDAIHAYRRFVREGIGNASVWTQLNRQVFLGDDDFVKRSLQHARVTDDVQVPKHQRRVPPQPLADYQHMHATRNDAIIAAYSSGGYSYQEIGAYFGLHFTTVGRIVRAGRPIVAHQS